MNKTAEIWLKITENSKTGLKNLEKFNIFTLKHLMLADVDQQKHNLQL